MINSTGTIRYRSNWWIWLECDYELGRYLRRLFFAQRFKVEKLGKPSWDEHITVVSSHEYLPTFPSLWGKHEGRECEFTVVLEPKTNGNAWWMPVKSVELEGLRIELGLEPERHIPLHFAVGYQYPGKVVESGCS